MKTSITILCILILILSCLFQISVFESECSTVTTFDDGVSQKTISFPGGGGIDESTWIEIPKKAIVTDASFDVSTVYTINHQYPLDPQIDVGGDGDPEWEFSGVGYGEYGRQNVFGDNMPGQPIHFDENKPFENQILIRLPKNATISSTSMNVRGGGAGKILMVKDGANTYGVSLMISALTNIGNSVTLVTEATLPLNWSDPNVYKAIFWLGGTSSGNGPSNSLLNSLTNYVKNGGNVFSSSSWIDYTGSYSGSYEIPYFEWVLHHTWGNRWNGGGSGIGTSNKYTHQYNSTHPVFNSPHTLPGYWNNLYTGTFWHSPAATINNGSIIGRVDTTTSNPRYNAIIAWDGPAFNPGYDRTLMVRQPIDRSWFNITQGDILSNFTENVASWFLGEGEAVNVTIDIGDNGGIPEFEHIGKLEDSKVVPEFNAELNSLLSALPVSFTDDYGIQFVDIPVNVTCEGTGTLLLSELNIKYNMSAKAFQNPHNANLIFELNELIPNSGEGNISIPIHIYSGTAGMIKVTNIYIDYYIPDLTNDRLLLVNGHGPDRICYADYENYLFIINITNKAGIDDVNNVTLILDAIDEQIKIHWERSTQTFFELFDPNDFITLDISDCQNIILDPERWHLQISIRFNWAYPNEALEVCAINTTNNSGAYVFEYFEDVYRVENDLDLVSSLEANSQYQGTLIEDGTNNWVRAQELITWSNLTAVYEGTNDIYPDNKNFNITLADDDTNYWSNSTSSGAPFVITTESDSVSDYSDIHHIDITDIPGTGLDVSDVTFMIKTDNTSPLVPPYIVCHADTPNDPETFADDDTTIYITWDDASDGSGSGVLEYAMEFNDPNPTTIKPSGTTAEGTEGKATFYVRARDKVGNWGTSGSASIFIDRTDLILCDPVPDPEIWQTSRNVECGICIKDIGGSGVLKSSVQYRYVDKGSIDTGAWYSYRGEVCGESVQCSQNITFEEDGVGKKIQWRAKDNAGNGFIYSNVYLIKIDSTPVNFKGFSIDFNKWYNTKSHKIDFFVNDTNPWDGGDVADGDDGDSSGVDVNSITYQLSTCGIDEYGNWQPLDATGSGESVKCTVDLEIEEGDRNFIRFKGNDLAGNNIISEHFNIKIDKANPIFSNQCPDDLTWNNATQLQCNITISDHSSKVDTKTIRYSISTNGTDNFGNWLKVNLKHYDNSEYHTLTITCNETFIGGVNNYIRWKASDTAGNTVTSENYKVKIDVTGCTFHNPVPGPEEWVNASKIECSIIINDTFGSGVDVNSIEYAISIGALNKMVEWKNTSLKLSDLTGAPKEADVGMGIGMEIETETEALTSVSASVWVCNLEEGDENYIYWRAKDLVNNEYELGGPYGIKLDQSPLEFLNPKPKPGTMQYELEQQCQITIEDVGGSGVNQRSIEYRYLITGFDRYSKWSAQEISYTKTVDGYISLVYITFKPGNSNFIQWRAYDNAGNGPFESETYKLIINSALKPLITSPRSEGEYYEQESYSFNAKMSTDPDIGDTLTFYWESNLSGFLGDSAYFKSDLPPGMHKITLHVSDNHNHNVSCHVSITVNRLDLDRDGIPDIYDSDIDGDDYPNNIDPFPQNKREWLDTDFDGMGNNADTDDDNDGYPDDVDEYPLDDTRWESETVKNRTLVNIVIALTIVIILIIILSAYAIVKRRLRISKLDRCQSDETKPKSISPYSAGTARPAIPITNSYNPYTTAAFGQGMPSYRMSMPIQIPHPYAPRLGSSYPQQGLDMQTQPLPAIPLKSGMMAQSMSPPAIPVKNRSQRI